MMPDDRLPLVPYEPSDPYQVPWPVPPVTAHPFPPVAPPTFPPIAPPYSASPWQWYGNPNPGQCPACGSIAGGNRCTGGVHVTVSHSETGRSRAEESSSRPSNPIEEFVLTLLIVLVMGCVAGFILLSF